VIRDAPGQEEIIRFRANVCSSLPHPTALRPRAPARASNAARPRHPPRL